MRISRRGYFTRPCSAALMLAVFCGPFIPRAATLGARPRLAKPVALPQQAPVPAPSVAVHHAKAATAPKMKLAAADGSARTPRDVFKGFGAWVDLYDFSLDPVRTVRTLAANGVQTLYVQTGRSDTAYMIDPQAWNWVVAAHRAKIKVVGWYLPYYADTNRDLARTLAIARRSYLGHRFDGLGIDIEFKGAVGGTRWNRRVAGLEATVRRKLGPAYPIAAIVPPPMQMWLAPRTWAGFPWKELARSSDAMLLMSYWTDRVGCPVIRRHCAFEFTDYNVRLTRKMIARPGVLVHIIGGIGNVSSLPQTRAFVQGVFRSHADGASFYDVNTTSSRAWLVLRQLAKLNAR